MGISDIPASVLEKLNKLKNMSDGAAAIGSYEESANAAEKFQALLLKHNLDEATFEKASVDHTSAMGSDEIETDERWTYRLIECVSRSCMCEVLYSRSHKYKHSPGRKYTILGEKTNVAVALYMIESLYTKIDIARRMAWDKYEGEENRQIFKKGFWIGCIEAIAIRLWKQEKTMKEADNGMAVVLFDRRKQALEYSQQQFPNIREVSGKSYTGGRSGYGEGVAAGKNMSFDKALGSVNKTQKKLGN